MALKRDPLSVFVNVPFDPQYQPLFEALIFAISASGYRVRCALEYDDSGDVRLDKLDQLIRTSTLSIHDLSRIEFGENDLPRFNMPFELGLAIGAKRFGVKRRDDKVKIMVAQAYKMPAYLSDLGGNDPSVHKNEPKEIIRIVRDFLHVDPSGSVLPGPKYLWTAFEKFRGAMPKMAAEINHDGDEITGFANYRTFLWCVVEFLRSDT